MIIEHQNGTTTALGGMTRRVAQGFIELVSASCVLGAVAQLRDLIDAADKQRQLWDDLAASPRWLARSDVARFFAGCPGNAPDSDIASFLQREFTEAALRYLEPEQLSLVAYLDGRDLVEKAEKRNERFIAEQKQRFKSYFDTIEANPLTDEQRRAVVTFDDNVMTVAAAGSGKTSVLVAKSGYALLAGLFKPEEILLLAFNRKAADELAERVSLRLGPNFGGAKQITVSTFHALGLQVISEATGKRPSVAAWIEQGREVEELEDIVKVLSKNRSFAKKWNLFKTVFARSLPPFGAVEEPEWWDPESGRRGFRTLRGETVKSQEERMICNWLSSQGIDYEYERPYEHETATTTRRQYMPDFYYPSANVYHEHFALDQNGNPPKDFTGYADGVSWKRELHAEQGTTLIETTSHGIRSQGGFTMFAEDLKVHGVPFGQTPLTSEQLEQAPEEAGLLRVFRTFMSHVKSNRLSMDDLRARAVSRQSEQPQRDMLFLDIFEGLWGEWDKRLADAGAVDFEDMLGQAVDYLAIGRCEMPYRLVMADEFQDSSRVRGALLKELTKSEESRLYVVGDDWQAVNRFAGADISMMRNFDKHIGPYTMTQLTWTFRCPEDICTIASSFVCANPYQIVKRMDTTNTRKDPSVFCFQLAGMGGQEALLKSHILQLADKIRRSDDDERVSAFVLGRYRNDKPLTFRAIAAEVSDVVDLEWSTIHAAKGLEADYVFLVNVIEAVMGLPSKIEDDSTLWIAMPDGEDYPHAEERRLFYVALTRAKRMVSIYTDVHCRSEFIAEIEKQNLGMQVRAAGGATKKKRACKECHSGVLVLRSGPFGEFLSCSRFPKCGYSENIVRHCPQCRSGKLIVKQSRHGRFFSCNRYPRCDYKENSKKQLRRKAS
ncbi:MAG: UvrD-helicase domain-containing protein [Gammaproteobacteria bacterium]